MASTTTPLSGRQLRLAILRNTTGPRGVPAAGVSAAAPATTSAAAPISVTSAPRPKPSAITAASAAASFGVTLKSVTTPAAPTPKPKSAGDLLNDFFSPDPLHGEGDSEPREKENALPNRKLDEELSRAETAKTPGKKVPPPPVLPRPKSVASIDALSQPSASSAASCATTSLTSTTTMSTSSSSSGVVESAAARTEASAPPAPLPFSASVIVPASSSNTTTSAPVAPAPAEIPRHPDTNPFHAPLALAATLNTIAVPAFLAPALISELAPTAAAACSPSINSTLPSSSTSSHTILPASTLKLNGSTAKAISTPTITTTTAATATTSVLGTSRLAAQWMPEGWLEDSAAPASTSRARALSPVKADPPAPLLRSYASSSSIDTMDEGSDRAPAKPPRGKRSASSLKSLELESAAPEIPEAETVTVVKRPKQDVEFRTRASTTSSGRPQTVVRPMSTWFKDTRKRPVDEEIERQSKIIDGIEKMLRIVSDDDEERLVQLYYELVTARATLTALQEARGAPPASSSRTRTLRLTKISLPVHWWATVTHRERSSFHFFLVFQVDSQVLYTSLVTVHGNEPVDELAFDEDIIFDSVAHGCPLLVKVYACKTTRSKDVAGAQGATPKKKAMDLAHTVAKGLQHTPRKLLERLTHHDRRHDGETLLADTPRRNKGIDFAQIATVAISSSTLVALPKVLELQMDGADTFPIGNTLCCSVGLTRNEADVVRHEGFITFFEQSAGSVGSWVRRRVLLDGQMMYCTLDGDVAQGGEAQEVTYDLSKYVDAEVRKIPRTECARLNSFALSVPEDCEHKTMIKMAADTKEAREEWLQLMTQSLQDLATWAASSSQA